MTTKLPELELSGENKTNCDKSRPELSLTKIGPFLFVGTKPSIKRPAIQTHESYLRARERFGKKGISVFSKQFNNSKVKLFSNIPNVEAHLSQVVPEKH